MAWRFRYRSAHVARLLAGDDSWFHLGRQQHADRQHLREGEERSSLHLVQHESSGLFSAHFHLPLAGMEALGHEREGLPHHEHCFARIERACSLACFGPAQSSRSDRWRDAVCRSSGERRIGRMDCRAEKHTVASVLFVVAFVLSQKLCCAEGAANFVILLLDIAGDVCVEPLEQNVRGHVAVRLVTGHLVE